MSLDRNQSADKQAPAIFVSPALVSMILVVGLFLLVTWHAFSTQRFAWLALIPGIPVAVFLINRRDLFLMVIVVFTEANIWLPLAGNDVPFHIFMRLALVGVLVGTAILDRHARIRWDFPRIATVLWLVVILATMAIRGSGIKQLGSHLWGGKNYIILVTSILFYLIIPAHIRFTRRQWLTAMVFMALLPLVSLLADVLYVQSNGRLYFLYYIFKPGEAISAATDVFLEEVGGIWRFKGASQLDLLLLCFLLSPRLGKSPHGKVFLGLLFIGSIFAAAFSGFRGSFIRIATVTLAFFWISRPHHRGRLVFVTLAMGVCMAVLAMTFGRSLPHPVQRVLSIFPMADIEPVVRVDADSSSSWRMEIWNLTLRNEVRPHLLVGRGLCFDPNQLIPQYSIRQETWESIQNAVTTGGFHSGPLSILVSFGLPGLLLLLGITVSSTVKHWRIHHRPWHDEWMRLIHLILLAYTLHLVLGFWLIYGDLNMVMLQYFSMLTFMEILAATRAEEVDLKNLVEVAPPKLLEEPVRARVIRFT